MVKHVILWRLRMSFPTPKKPPSRQASKRAWKDWPVRSPVWWTSASTSTRSSSNADLMLDTTFESAEALKGYSTHPAHVAVANSKVRPYYKNRVCLDYEV